MEDYHIRHINLDELPARDGVRFVEAQWWDARAPFAVIVCLYRGELMKLRMDLDKRVFIDHVEDERLDGVIAAAAMEVWEVVVKYRYPAMMQVMG